MLRHDVCDVLVIFNVMRLAVAAAKVAGEVTVAISIFLRR